MRNVKRHILSNDMALDLNFKQVPVLFPPFFKIPVASQNTSHSHTHTLNKCLINIWIRFFFLEHGRNAFAPIVHITVKTLTNKKHWCGLNVSGI